jgi:hypothetical protein
MERACERIEAIVSREGQIEMSACTFCELAVLRLGVCRHWTRRNSSEYLIENPNDRLFDKQRVRRSVASNVLDDSTLTEKGSGVDSAEVDLEQAAIGVGRSQSARRKHLSQHRRGHREPIGSISLAIDRSTLVRMPRVV